MAKIEMDISEYEAMKENKTLLEKSLIHERSLQEQIKKLTDEKTKALEDAKMKVVKITKTEITEHIVRKRDDNFIWRELWHMLGLEQRSIPTMPNFIRTDYLINAFFEKIKSYSMPVEEITMHGLDEIKTEIRNDLHAKIDAETNQKIKDAETILLKNDELLKANRILTIDNDTLTENNKKLVKELDEITKKLTNINNNNKLLSDVKDILKNGYGFWNKSKILDRIISIIK